jgi:hypothetical protein
LTFLEFFGYNYRMARPPKDKSERKDYDLRVPLTDAQRQLIEEASRAAELDKAAWARAILLRAARDQLSVTEVKKAGRK